MQAAGRRVASPSFRGRTSTLHPEPAGWLYRVAAKVRVAGEQRPQPVLSTGTADIRFPHSVLSGASAHTLGVRKTASTPCSSVRLEVQGVGWPLRLPSDRAAAPCPSRGGHSLSRPEPRLHLRAWYFILSGRNVLDSSASSLETEVGEPI